MTENPFASAPGCSGKARQLAAGLLCLVVSLALGGCVSGPLARHAAAFSHATDLLTASAEDAYRAANRLRREEEIARAVGQYGSPGWRPDQEMDPLLTPAQIDARLTVLDGLKTYAATLVQLTGKPSDKDKAALNGAAASVGSNLKSLEKTAAKNFDKALKGTASAGKFPEMTAIEANLTSTALRGLGNYLIQRKLRRSLPKVVEAEDGNVENLCTLLSRDLAILRREADVDYGDLIGGQDQFLGATGKGLDPGQRRVEVARLLELAAAERANDRTLARLQQAIADLGAAHHALGEAARQNDPESLREKLAELIAAGRELGTFYSSLPAS